MSIPHLEWDTALTAGRITFRLLLNGRQVATVIDRGSYYTIEVRTDLPPERRLRSDARWLRQAQRWTVRWVWAHRGRILGEWNCAVQNHGPIA